MANNPANTIKLIRNGAIILSFPLRMGQNTCINPERPMPPHSLLTLSQQALLAEIDASPITMDVAELTDTSRGHDLQALGQLGLIRMGPDEAGREPIRFSYARARPPLR